MEINQVKDNQREALERIAQEYRLNLAGIVPEDSRIRDFDLEGKPTIGLDKESQACISAFSIFSYMSCASSS